MTEQRQQGDGDFGIGLRLDGERIALCTGRKQEDGTLAPQEIIITEFEADRLIDMLIDATVNLRLNKKEI